MNLELGSKLAQQHRLERLAQAQTYRQAKPQIAWQDRLLERLWAKAERIASNLRRKPQMDLG